MNIFFIGMGNMGQHRLKAIRSLKNKFNLNVIGFYDPSIKSIIWNNKKIHSETSINIKFLKDTKADFFIIGTPHYLIFEYIKDILTSKLSCSILVEKPLGIDYQEALKIGKLKSIKQNIFVGLNYRYFKGINALLNDLKENKFGQINSLNINMGHGHSSTIKDSWKINKKQAGGGVIIDPGIHVINLMQLFAGNEVEIVAKHSTSMNFWKTGIEEQCNLLFESKKIPLIHLNISILRWRSSFEISIFGNEGYGIINGRGSHYGQQVYRTGKRWSWENSNFKNQIDTEQLISNSEEDNVFETELENVFDCINGNNYQRKPCLFDEAVDTMKMTSKIYSYG